MRSSRASSVRDAERRRKAADLEHSHSRTDKSPDRHSLHRQERLDPIASSAYGIPPKESGRCLAFAPPAPPVILVSSGELSTVCDACDAPGMNTLAAQTAACTGGSSYSINQVHHCECSHENNGNHVNHYHDDPEDDVFTSSPGSPRTKQEMRWELRYFFMNPYLKYKKRGRIPWKLSIQVLKIFFVTTQLVYFGLSNSSLNEFYEGNREAFEHLFLNGWDTGFDSKAYPRSDQLYAVYELNSFYENLDHVAYQFANLKENAIGTYGYDHRDGEERKLHVWQQNYDRIKITEDGRFFINQTLREESLIIILPETLKKNISVKDYLADHNQTINADTLRLFRLQFVVGSLHLKDTDTFNIPDCIIFNTTIEYNNIAHNGRMPIELKVQHDFLRNCSNTYGDDNLSTSAAKLMLALDMLIILLCFLSAVMCVRSFMRAQSLKMVCFTKI